MMEYIKITEFKHLIGKRARFKDNLKGYCSKLWLKEGTIKQNFSVTPGDLDHVGLSIVFDKKENNMTSCYIALNSFEVLE